jgi:hypothetical protein
MEDFEEFKVDPKDTIKTARDSVYVIKNTIRQLDEGKLYTKNRQSDIDRNVGHLKIVVAQKEVIESGEDISDLHDAIALGEAKLALFP